MNNTRVFRFLSIALLAAIALYFAAQGYFALTDPRSEERRVGKECRSRWSPYH